MLHVLAIEKKVEVLKITMIFLCTCEGLVPRLVFSVLRNDHTRQTG